MHSDILHKLPIFRLCSVTEYLLRTQAWPETRPAANDNLDATTGTVSRSTTKAKAAEPIRLGAPKGTSAPSFGAEDATFPPPLPSGLA
jgi:hypothetical protein